MNSNLENPSSAYSTVEYLDKVHSLNRDSLPGDRNRERKGDTNGKKIIDLAGGGPEQQYYSNSFVQDRSE